MQNHGVSQVSMIPLDASQRIIKWSSEVLYLNTIARNASKRLVKRGSVYKCKLGCGVGSEEGKERPCVVLQYDPANRRSPNTIVAPITHSSSALPVVVKIDDKLDSKGNVLLDGNVLLGNVVTVSKARLGDYICDLTSDEMLKVDTAISLAMGIKEHYDKLQNKYNDKLKYIEKLKEKVDELNGKVNELMKK